MKKQAAIKKFQLNKETIANLENGKLAGIVGGVTGAPCASDLATICNTCTCPGGW